MLAVTPFLLFASLLVNAAPLKRRDVASILSNCNHNFAYTWDDGPWINHNTINQIFSNAQSHTTFFINGNNWSCIYDDDNVSALRASYEAGHQLAHHTWSHPDLKTLTHSQIDIEIGRLNDAFVRILGVKPKIFRPPYGSVNDTIAEYIEQKFGLTVVLWSDDSLDSDGEISEQWNYNFYSGLAAAGNASPHMTLSHETVQGSVQALGNGTATTLKAAGIDLITVAACLDMDPYEVVTGYYGTPDDSWTCSGDWVPATFSDSSSSSSTTSTTTSSTSTASTTTSSSTSSTSPTCQSWYYPSSATTCNAVAAIYGVQAADIQSANSFVDCGNIWAHTPLCIPSSSGGSVSTTTTSSSTPTASSTCTSWYQASTATTCDAIAASNGVQASDIASANSFVNCADIWAGTVLCIPPAATPSCITTYISVSGDTCDSIASKYGLQANQIASANAYLNCNDIWAFSPICIPPGGSTPCTKTISSQPGDTCDTIAQANGVTAQQISDWNAFLNCSDIWNNTPVCVSHS